MVYRKHQLQPRYTIFLSLSQSLYLVHTMGCSSSVVANANIYQLKSSESNELRKPISRRSRNFTKGDQRQVHADWSDTNSPINNNIHAKDDQVSGSDLDDSTYPSPGHCHPKGSFSVQKKRVSFPDDGLVGLGMSSVRQAPPIVMWNWLNGSCPFHSSQYLMFLLLHIHMSIDLLCCLLTPVNGYVQGRFMLGELSRYHLSRKSK